MSSNLSDREPDIAYMIRAITFDLWNTLLVEKSYTEGRLMILAEALDIEGQHVFEEDLERAYSAAQMRHNQLWSEEYCHYPLADRIDEILKGVKRSLSPALREAVMDKLGNIILYDPPSLTKGAKNTVERLYPTFRLGIISDTGVTSGKNIRKVLDRAGILCGFTSSVLG